MLTITTAAIPAAARAAAAAYPARPAPGGGEISLTELLNELEAAGGRIAWNGRRWKATPPPAGPGCAFADPAAVAQWSRVRVDPVRGDLLHLLRHLPPEGEPLSTNRGNGGAATTVHEAREGAGAGGAEGDPSQGQRTAVGPEGADAAAHTGWSPPPMQWVQSLDELRRVLAETVALPLVGLDVETAARPGAPEFAPLAAALDPHRGRVRLLQIATADRVYLTDAFKVPLLGAAEALREWLADRRGRKLTHNGKFDLQMLRAALGGAPLPDPNLGDTMLWDQLLACGLPPVDGHGLAATAARHLGVVLPKEQQAGDWSVGDLSQQQVEYAARDAAVLVPLAEALQAKLAELGLQRVADLEDGCLPAVADMIYVGIGFDLPYWRRLTEEVRGAAEAAAGRVRALLGGPKATVQVSLFGIKTEIGGINLDSNVQVRQALGRVGIEVESTGDEVLRPLAGRYPVVAALLEYRKQSKLLSAFCEAIPRFAHPADGRIHAGYRQLNKNGVGRFSSNQPNIQQVPRDKSFRRAFVAPEGKRLVIADYSMIELRLVAEIAGDQRMLEAFARRAAAQTVEERERWDLHRQTAGLVLGKDAASVTKAERQLGKPTNFGLIYSLGAAGLANSATNNYGVTMSLEQAERYKARFFQHYSGIAAWHRQERSRVESAIRRGDWGEVCARTITGRLRRFPWTDPFRMRIGEVFNSPVQGSGADLLKAAMIRLRPWLIWSGFDLVGSIHDELVFEVPQASAAEAAEHIRQEMEAAGSEFGLKVPVEAEVSIGGSWADKS